jgi:hypothetical protein
MLLNREKTQLQRSVFDPHIFMIKVRSFDQFLLTYLLTNGESWREF